LAALLACTAGAAPTGPQHTTKTYELNFGNLHLRLTPGVLGLAVIFILLVLLAVAVVLAIVARRRARQARAAGQGLQAQLERLNLLDQITRAIGERLDLRSVFQVAIHSLEDHLPIDFGFVCLYEPGAAVLTVTCVGMRSEALAMELGLTEQSHIDIDRNGLAKCISGKLVYEPDIRQSEYRFPRRLARGGLCSFVAAPLEVESGIFGVLIAARQQQNSFSSRDCEFLRQLSGHVALAAHQAQVYSALQQAYDDLRQTQQAVQQQERLRALGQMASGIAHDINNALSPVAIYTESLLEREPGLSVRTRQYLEITQRAIDDVAHTVGRMREFYRQPEKQLTLSPVDVNQLVQQVLDLTRARWNDMAQQRGIVVQIQTELAPDLPAIPGIESEIREALVNLIFNGVDAMPEGGSLTLRTRVSPGESPASASPRHVHVEVEDTGLGMDEETRRRCLEPFFTTKGERGTGLGLAMVFGVVQRHNGEIEIESGPGKGTTVRLILPIAVASSETAEPTRPNKVLSRLRILVVDDDPIIIKSLRDALEADGHAVIAANGGQEGIDVFRAAENGERFAVVITDLGMPRVDGRKVASAVKAAHPCTPVIMLTGWGQRLVAEGDIPPHVDRVLNKPPKLRELRTALTELMNPNPAKSL
jgi:signal transduction histidine kinase/ActR/RegA family two-component response regulator